MAEDSGDDDGLIRHLPFAQGRGFASLDQYLNHLRERVGPIGQPWYREIAPDRYALVTVMAPAGPAQTFSRAELIGR